MKKRLIQVMIVAFGLSSFTYADCAKVPDGAELNTALEAKTYDKAQSLLDKFKLDIKNYLDKCDKSEAMFEQTHVSILTYEDKLSDLKEDLKGSKVSQKSTVDCSKPPSSKDLDKAFKSKSSNQIKALYATFKTDAERYMDQCASHEEYEFVFEAALLYEEQYAEWEKSVKK